MLCVAPPTILTLESHNRTQLFVDPDWVTRQRFLESTLGRVCHFISVPFSLKQNKGEEVSCVHKTQWLIWSVWENVLVTSAHTPQLCLQTRLPQEAENSSCYQSPQRDFITSSSTDNKSERDTILCKWQWIFHLGLLMCKDVYIEGNAFITANQRREAFLKRKIYQEFLQDKRCDLGLCSWKWCVSEDDGNCRGIVWLPPPHWHKAALYKWAPACCGGGDENSQSPHIYLTSCGSPGYHFLALSFVDAAILLANDINTSVVSHLWAVAIFSKSAWSGKLKIH